MTSTEKRPYTTSFVDFIDHCGLEDIEDAYDAHLAVSSKASVGRWRLRTKNRKLHVDGPGATLILASTKAEYAFVRHLDRCFGGGEGLVARYVFMRAMGKD